jgi:hypothetical protein
MILDYAIDEISKHHFFIKEGFASLLPEILILDEFFYTILGCVLNDYFVLSLCYTIQYFIEKINNLSKSGLEIKNHQSYAEIS